MSGVKVNTGAKRRGNYISDLQCQIWLILYLTQISTVTPVMPTPVVYLNQPACVSWPSSIILLLEADWKLQGSLVNYHFRLNNSNLIKAQILFNQLSKKGERIAWQGEKYKVHSGGWEKEKKRWSGKIHCMQSGISKQHCKAQVHNC